MTCKQEKIIFKFTMMVFICRREEIMIKLRMIKEDDIREVLSIYRPYVTNTPISFEYTVPSYRKFTKRVHKITATYPWIVAEINQIGRAHV